MQAAEEKKGKKSKAKKKAGKATKGVCLILGVLSKIYFSWQSSLSLAAAHLI